ncbi:MAG: hypothetical protein KF880_01335 [Ferruginibacter sp.]|nr:hypothetical protein [Ferruginibacter sp.]
MIKTTHKIVFGALIGFSLACVSSCAPATRTLAVEEGWELIGEEKANFVKDRDEIMVNSTSLFTDIRIKVENKKLIVHNFKVVYPNGDKMQPAMPSSLSPNQYSSVIHLSPTGRQLRSVEFKYRSTGNILKGRGRVLIFGKRYTGY